MTLKSLRMVAVITATGAMLLGCSTFTADQATYIPLVIRTPLRSEAAYDRINVASRTCYATGAPMITTDFIASTHRGTIRYETSTEHIGSVAFEQDRMGSVLVMKLRGDSDNELASAIPAWLRGETVACPYRS